MSDNKGFTKYNILEWKFELDRLDYDSQATGAERYFV